MLLCRRNDIVILGHANRFLTCLLEKLWTSKLTSITYQTIGVEDNA